MQKIELFYEYNSRIAQALAQEKADAIYKEVAYPDWLPSNDELDKYFEGVNSINVYYDDFDKCCFLYDALLSPTASNRVFLYCHRSLRHTLIET